ncbi:MAG: saccharopine dehydrogenase NADP-binding domain-containing protein, partial [Cyclobacteriaceae bacterium]|nr:saccharopine dehydrogenase NADP-binding domain-containing protein [Cyclobacteriaceae bacterium]
MKTILIFGSGRSAPSLIKYLVKKSVEFDWQVIIADKDTALVKTYISGFQNCVVVHLDITDDKSRDELVSKSDLVLSMLPFRFHELVLKSCLIHKIDLITPSYESKEMKELETEIEKSGILVLNEMGLDPGIDHMSAMKVIDEIRIDGHNLTAFESFTGGLMAPGYDENPWGYKFTWNPRNVILAGQGGAVRFLHNGRHKYIPYTKVFRRTEKIEIEEYGTFEGYANRDSLDYLGKYDLEGVSTIYRGTLRRPGFCRAWDLFVQLG